MFQQIQLIGHLGSDPEMRYMPNGTAVTNLSVATNHRWTDKSSGEVKEEVTWFRVSVWGNLAETVNQHLSKGRQVMVIGRLRPDSNTGGPRLWQRQDGTVGSSFEVVAEKIQFLGSKNGNGQEAVTAEENGDDIPF